MSSVFSTLLTDSVRSKEVDSYEERVFYFPYPPLEVVWDGNKYVVQPLSRLLLKSTRKCKGLKTTTTQEQKKFDETRLFINGVLALFMSNTNVQE